MNKSDVHEFWKNPDSDKFNVGEKYRAKCRPEHYLQFEDVSKMWLDAFMKFIDPEWSIVELGCSVGRNLYYLKQSGYYNLKGVEINPQAKDIASWAHGRDISDIITTSSIEDYIPDSPFFDVVFTSGVLMHIHPESEWVFKHIAETARKYLMIAEVEKPRGKYKWPRDYRAIFEVMGFQQVHEQEATPMSRQTVLRVFRRLS